MSESSQKAKRKYENNRNVKRVSFNIHTEADLLEFANSVDFSNWVKKQIKHQISSSPLI